MNAHSLILLTAVVLSTSACAGNSVKPSAVVSSPSTIEAPPSPQTATDDTSSGATALAAATANTPPRLGAAAPKVSSAGDRTGADQDAAERDSEKIAQDPWESYNRRMHSFNNVVDKYFARPLAITYDKVTPDAVQSGVSRFFRNLREPGTAVNQALQGRPTHAAQSMGRFAVNTTVGIGGVFDPATYWGMKKRDGEDFGQTMATWGWRDSRYLVIPLLGPRTVRDTVAIVGDQKLSPIGYVEDTGAANALQILQMADGRARLLPMDQARRDALDEYTFVRDVWTQRRKHQIEQDLKSNRD
ncbi:MAG: VacJ family lipoprotein [Burkholderiaceae bacterium]|nr:VacJ family lipoprotein [Burkholderiaceae bacterium]